MIKVIQSVATMTNFGPVSSLPDSKKTGPQLCVAVFFFRGNCLNSQTTNNFAMYDNANSRRLHPRYILKKENESQNRVT